MFNRCTENKMRNHYNSKDFFKTLIKSLSEQQFIFPVYALQ